jgi:inner membrane protein
MSNTNIDSVIQSAKSQRKLYFKMSFILLLILLLLIPNAFISDLIHERSSLLYQTQQDIARTWGNKQKICGPLLAIPYTSSYFDKDQNKSSIFTHTLYVAPESVIIDTDVTTEERKKGIYSTTLYTADNNIEAKFVIPEKEAFGKKMNSISWEEASIIIPLTQPSSVISKVDLMYGSEPYKMRSYNSSNLGNSLQAIIDIKDQSTIEVSANLKLRGSQSLEYIATGEDHQTSMNCDWPSPGFQGSMLPVTREISTDGFTAAWSANEYSRPMPDLWKDNDYRLGNSEQAFGVKLVQTVDHYQKNFRSVKYALLIISLSFLIFFFFEVLNGRKIHPLQYILIGLGLSLFYLLLLSLSEHVGFNLAYGIASIGTISLVTWYSSTMLRAGKSVMILGATLIGLYGYIFVLLQMEDYALLAGAIGLFVILAIVMALSRKMDWYSY